LHSLDEIMMGLASRVNYERNAHAIAGETFPTDNTIEDGVFFCTVCVLSLTVRGLEVFHTTRLGGLKFVQLVQINCPVSVNLSSCDAENSLKFIVKKGVFRFVPVVELGFVDASTLDVETSMDIEHIMRDAKIMSGRLYVTGSAFAPVFGAVINHFVRDVITSIG